MAEHDEDELKARVLKVWQAASDYHADIQNTSLNQTLVTAIQQFNALTPSEKGAAPATAGEEPEDLDISDFFQSVGQGLVAAQEDLDDRTLKSLRKPRPHAAPAVYRIPKVTAEIQFALRSTRSKKFGILLFREGKEEEAQRQHKVTFDIVAAPPPPDVLALVDQLDLGPVFVTDPGEREIVRQRLETAAAGDKVANKKAKRFVTPANFLKTLIVGVDEGWLCVLPLGGGPNLDVLKVFRGEGVRAEGATKDEPPALTRRLRDLARVLVELSERQAQGLKELNKRAGI